MFRREYGPFELLGHAIDKFHPAGAEIMTGRLTADIGAPETPLWQIDCWVCRYCPRERSQCPTIAQDNRRAIHAEIRVIHPREGLVARVGFNHARISSS